MSNEFGSKQEGLPGISSGRYDGLDKLKADISQNINGYLIEVNIYDTKSVVTIDGKVFDGTFSDAVANCGRRQVRWNGLFE